MAEYIYSMVRARKAVGDKVILDDVTMAFLPGAKIGVVGPNGAGKSTILKIMAGLDTPSNGDAKLSPGYTVGILMQEPELDEDKTVLENVQEGVGEIKQKVDRFNEISGLLADPDADFDTLLAEMGTLQEQLGQRDPALLTAGEILDTRVARGRAQGIHRLLQLRVEIPGVGRVDLGLQFAHLGEQGVEVGVRIGHRR